MRLISARSVVRIHLSPPKTVGDGENKDGAYTKYKGAVRRRVTRIHLSPPKTVGEGENKDGAYTKYKGAVRQLSGTEILRRPVV